VKDARKTKQILVLENEKRHADFKIKLKHYGITQSDFLRGCISGLINDDAKFLDFFFKVLEEQSYIKSKKRRNKNKTLIKRGLKQMGEFGLEEDEIDNIFDLIEKEHPDL